MKKQLAISASALFGVLASVWSGAKLMLDYLGRIGAAQDLNEPKGAFASALHWLFTTPAWVPALIALLMALLLIVLTIRAVSGSKTALPKSPAASPLQAPILEVSGVFGPTTARGAVFKATFARTGRDVSFYVEYSVWIDALMGPRTWSHPSKVFLQNIDRFVKGETITVPIFGRHKIGSVNYWKFGQLDENKHMISGGGSYYRCRVIAIEQDGTEIYTYFVSAMNNHEAGPDIIGEHLFEHMKEWEGLPPRNPNIATLFSHT